MAREISPLLDALVQSVRPDQVRVLVERLPPELTVDQVLLFEEILRATSVRRQEKESQVAFTKEQPKDGDTIMHCGHVVGCMHWFQYEKARGFQRLDGSRGEASWFAACERCFIRHGEKVVDYVRGDGIWNGDEPAIERTES